MLALPDVSESDDVFEGADEQVVIESEPVSEPQASEKPESEPDIEQEAFFQTRESAHQDEAGDDVPDKGSNKPTATRGKPVDK